MVLSEVVVSGTSSEKSAQAGKAPSHSISFAEKYHPASNANGIASKKSNFVYIFTVFCSTGSEERREAHKKDFALLRVFT